MVVIKFKQGDKMKTLTITQMTSLEGGRTADNTCGFLGGVAVGAACSGNLLAFAICGSFFAACCM